MTRRLVSCLLLAMLGLAAPAWAATDVILASPSPGTLEITWTPTPNTVITDYRVMWARADQGFGSWRDSNTETLGNEYPTTNSLTLSGLEEGQTYKVKVRSRQAVNRRFVWQSPWSEVASLEVSRTVTPPPVVEEETVVEEVTVVEDEETVPPAVVVEELVVTLDQDDPASASQGVDDFAADTSTAGAVSVGGSATGSIESAGDVDWFAVDLEGGKGYYISIAGSGDDALGCPRGRGVYGADGGAVTGLSYTYPIPSSFGSNLGDVYFAPEASGTYYIVVDDCVDIGTGTYTMTVTANPDDYPADTSTPSRFTVGDSWGASGEIESSSDADWFAVVLDASWAYDFKVAGGGDGSMWGYVELEEPIINGIYDAAGTLIDGTVGAVGELNFIAPTGATFYVSVGGVGLSVGHYRLTVRRTSNDIASTQRVLPADADSVQAGAQALGNLRAIEGGSYEIDGTVNGGDDLVDYYSFEVPATREVQLTLTEQEYDADLTLEDLSGTALASSAGDGTADESLKETLKAGSYRIRVAAQEAGENGYKLAFPLEIPYAWQFVKTYNGNVVWRDSTDVDLEAGKTYVLDMRGLHSGKGTLWAGRIYGIYDCPGRSCDRFPGTNNRYSGGAGYGNSRVVWTPAESGTYYVQMGPGAGWESGTYELTVHEVGGRRDRHPDNTATLGVLEVNSSNVEVYVDSKSDVDWFRMELEAGEVYYWSYNTLRGSLRTDLYDADCNWVKPAYRNPVSVEGEREWFGVAESGTYFLGVSRASWSRTDTPRGAYDFLTVVDDFSADTDTTATLEVNGASSNGKMDMWGDRDWFKVELEEGTTCRFEMRTRNDDLGYFHLEGLYDAEGDSVSGFRSWSDYDGTDEENHAYGVVSIGAGQGGTYYLGVTGYASFCNGDNWDLGDYKVSARCWD